MGDRMRLTINLTMLALAGFGLMSCHAAADTHAATQPAAAAPQPYFHDAATALYRQGKYAEEESLCRNAIAAIEKSAGDHSPQLAPPLDDLGGIYLRQGRFADAKAPLDRAESVLDLSKPADAVTYAHLCINKGWLQYSLGNIDAAETTFIDGRKLLEKYQTSPTVDLAELINNVALAYEDNEAEDKTKIADAKVLLLKSWELRRKLTGPESAESGESLNNLGMYLLFHSEDEDGIGTVLLTLKKALAVNEKVYGKDNPETASSLANMAMAYHLTQQDDLAEREIRLAIPMTEKFLGKDNPDRAYELQVLGQILQSQQKYREAEADFLEAVKLTERTYGPDHDFVASSLDYLDGLYQASGDTVSMRAVEKRIEKIRGRDI
jgi:tetratricopeptide (TPR) repeat protein